MGSLLTASDLMCCRDRQLWDTIMSDPRHVLYDFPRKDIEGACVIAAIILYFQYALSVLKVLFANRRLFSIHLTVFSLLGKNE